MSTNDLIVKAGDVLSYIITDKSANFAYTTNNHSVYRYDVVPNDIIPDYQLTKAGYTKLPDTPLLSVYVSKCFYFVANQTRVHNAAKSDNLLTFDLSLLNILIDAPIKFQKKVPVQVFNILFLLFLFPIYIYKVSLNFDV